MQEMPSRPLIEQRPEGQGEKGLQIKSLESRQWHGGPDCGAEMCFHCQTFGAAKAGRRTVEREGTLSAINVPVPHLTKAGAQGFLAASCIRALLHRAALCPGAAMRGESP